MAVQKILKEDTTTAVEISEEDVSLYAEQLGIDVTKEKHLLWIAKKGLEAPVPKPWCPVEDEKGRIYYYNQATDKSSWEHPADEHFRKLVKQERDKHIISKEDTELGIESELSSLDDVPPLTSGKNSISAQMDESNLRSSGRRMGSLNRLHELANEEKFVDTPYLKRSVVENEFGVNNETKTMGKRSTLRNDPLIKVTSNNSLNHSTDDDLSTGLDGIGFDRFAEQYGIMDASRLSPVIPSSHMEKDKSYMKSQPMPKNLLKKLFSTSKDTDQTLSEGRNNQQLSFAEFLKEAEEYSNKSLSRDKSQNSLEENLSEENHSKNLSNGSAPNNSMKEDSEHEDIQDSKKCTDGLANDNDKFKPNLLIIEDKWKRRLEEKEKELRLEHEKKIAEFKEKLEEERKNEEKKLNDAILLMKEENSVVLAKQEQVLTEELEADLESAKEEIEMKRLATLQAIQEQEEIYEKELEEKKNDVVQTFDSQVQELYAEMEAKLEEKKKEIEQSYQQEIDNLNEEHAKHLVELKNNFEMKLEKELEEKKQETEKIHQMEIENLNREHSKHLEDLTKDFELKMEDELEERKQKIEKSHQEQIDNLNEEHAKHLENLTKDFELRMEKELEKKRQEIEKNHQEEMANLNQENAKHPDDMEFSKEVTTLKEELNSLKEQIEAEKHALQQLQEDKLVLEQQVETAKHTLEQIEEEKGMVEEQIETGKKSLEKLQEEKHQMEEEKAQLSELLQEEEITKHNKEIERNKLLEEKNVLQNEIIELKNELTEQREALQSLMTNKSTLEAEIHLVKEELKHLSLLQQAERMPSSCFADKYTDTYDLLVNSHSVSEKEKYEYDDKGSIDYLPENGSAIAGYCVTYTGENQISFGSDKKHEIGDSHNSARRNGKVQYKEDKMERLEIKIDALEKAFRLLEMKIGSTLVPKLSQSDKPYLDNNNDGDKIPKKDKKCECCNNKIHTAFAPELPNNVEQLFNSEELKHLQNTPNKYSVFCMPNAEDAQCYESNLVYNIYSRDISLSPLYVAGKETERFPFTRSDASIQLEQCKEKFRNLQAKHEISQLNIELIKKEILEDMSRKDVDNNNKIQDLTYQQSSSQMCGAAHLESQYTENLLPTTGLNKIITLPTKNVLNADLHPTLWQDAQKYIEKEEQLNDKNYSCELIEEQGNNPLDQFFALTETALDKELGLLSKDENKKHYLSYPILNENSSNAFLDSFEKLNDLHTNDASHSGPSTNYKPIYCNQPSILGELVTEKEDWMGKLGNMYQRIRAYERDLILRRSLKT